MVVLARELRDNPALLRSAYCSAAAPISPPPYLRRRPLSPIYQAERSMVPASRHGSRTRAVPFEKYWGHERYDIAPPT